MNNIPCLICGRPSAQFDSDRRMYLNEAVVFHARGNYGSTMFDGKVDVGVLNLAVCDNCLAKHADRVQHAVYSSELTQSLENYLREGED